MSWLWVIPVAVFAGGAVVVTVSVRRMADATDGLRREVNRLARLGDDIALVREDATRITEEVAAVRGRAPKLRR